MKRKRKKREGKRSNMERGKEDERGRGGRGCVCVGTRGVMGMSEGWRYINEINGVKSREGRAGGRVVMC